MTVGVGGVPGALAPPAATTAAPADGAEICALAAASADDCALDAAPATNAVAAELPVADVAPPLALAAGVPNPRVPRFNRSPITLDADTARASPFCARFAAAAAISPRRSMKYRFALSP